MNTQAMFSLFDGHGGRHAADFAASHLHDNILSEIGERKGDVPAGIVEGYLRTDRDFLSGGKGSGAAAVTALLKDGTLWVGAPPSMPSGAKTSIFTQKRIPPKPLHPVDLTRTPPQRLYPHLHSQNRQSAPLCAGHVGDCRAVLCCAGTAEALTVDHKPERPAERARIEGQGGEVLCGGKGAWRVQGVLGVSRAIGDRDLKPARHPTAKRFLGPPCFPRAFSRAGPAPLQLQRLSQCAPSSLSLARSLIDSPHFSPPIPHSPASLSISRRCRTSPGESSRRTASSSFSPRTGADPLNGTPFIICNLR